MAKLTEIEVSAWQGAHGGYFFIAFGRYSFRYSSVSGQWEYHGHVALGQTLTSIGRCLRLLNDERPSFAFFDRLLRRGFAAREQSDVAEALETFEYWEQRVVEETREAARQQQVPA